MKSSRQTLNLIQNEYHKNDLTTHRNIHFKARNENTLKIVFKIILFMELFTEIT